MNKIVKNKVWIYNKINMMINKKDKEVKNKNKNKRKLILKNRIKIL
jgi:hypothetical protein